MQKTDEPRGTSSDHFSEEQLQVYVRQVLCGQLFAGDYCERSFVPQLGSYRDVVELCARERDLRNTLEDVQARLQQHYGRDVWTGISSAGSRDKLRVHVSLKDVAFGRYWFHLKNVKFTSSEVVLRLKCLRPLAEGGVEGSEGAEQTPQQPVDWDRLLEDWKQALSRGAATALSVNNVRQAVVFLLVVLVSLLTGVIHAVRHLGDFSIRVLHEMSGLVRALTPLALAVIDFFSKCVGGLYILVAMLFRGQGMPPPPQTSRLGTMRAIKYGR